MVLYRAPNFNGEVTPVEKHNLRGQIHNAMYQNIHEKGYIAPVDVLMDIGVLSKQAYEDWRFGKVPFLEKVCNANLRALSGIMKEVRAYAAKNALKPSWTYYHQWGKHRDRKLRFSKSGDEAIERSYATHFVDVNRIGQLKNPSPQEPEE
jgi:hypothetical protein